MYAYIYIHAYNTEPYHTNIYGNYFIRNSNPEFPGFDIVFPYVDKDFSKHLPDPGRNLHISYHTAEPYYFYL